MNREISWKAGANNNIFSKDDRMIGLLAGIYGWIEIEQDKFI